MAVTYYARGDSSAANNAYINAEPLTTTSSTTLEFSQDSWDDILSDGTTGTMLVDGEEHTYQLEFVGTIPFAQKYSNVAGNDLRGEEVVVLTDTTTGQRYFFFTNPDLNVDGSIITDFPNGSTALDGYTLICFLRGTQIGTAAGPKPVEELVAGDLVSTDAGPLPIAWVGSRVLSAGVLAQNPELLPVRFNSGALGRGRPSAELSLSPDHRVVVEGAEVELALGVPRALCAAKFLAGRPGITKAPPTGEVEYFHILLSSHRILTANGAECESLSHGPRARDALGPELCDRLMAEGVLKTEEGRAPLPVLRRFEALALA